MALRTRRRASWALLAGGTATAIAATVGTAQAALPAHSKVVQEDAANNTPNVTSDGEVVKLLQVGGVMYAGGRFSTVAPAGTTTGGVTRNHMFAFNPITGAISSTFHPIFNGEVDGLASDGTYLYVGGQFSTVNGIQRRGLVKLTLGGEIVPGFDTSRSINSNVYDVQLVNKRLLVGGSFSKRLVALDPVTGVDTGYISASISGTTASNAGSTDVYRFAVNPAGDRLVAIGNFTAVGGQRHYRAFILNLGASTTTVSTWYYQPLERMCKASSIPAYLRDVDFSPNGSYFVLVATGYIPYLDVHVGTSVCDAAARFEIGTLAPTAPTWINYTGGDTLHSVTITGAAVYVGGHQRWLDNPYGNNSAGRGAVERPGLGAIDPATGKALAWNPTRARGVGAKELYPTSTGLWIGHDTDLVHGEKRMKAAFFPL